MNEINFSTSACRYCRSYKPEGRRGGSCQRLGVPVQGSWKACTFASSPFETTVKKLEDIFYLPASIELKSNSLIASNLSKSKVGESCQTIVSNKQE